MDIHLHGAKDIQLEPHVLRSSHTCGILKATLLVPVLGLVGPA